MYIVVTHALSRATILLLYFLLSEGILVLCLDAFLLSYIYLSTCLLHMYYMRLCSKKLVFDTRTLVQLRELTLFEEGYWMRGEKRAVLFFSLSLCMVKREKKNNNIIAPGCIASQRYPQQKNRNNKSTTCLVYKKFQLTTTNSFYSIQILRTLKEIIIFRN